MQEMGGRRAMRQEAKQNAGNSASIGIPRCPLKAPLLTLPIICSTAQSPERRKSVDMLLSRKERHLADLMVGIGEALC